MIQTGNFLDCRKIGLVASAARPAFSCPDFSRLYPYFSSGGSFRRKESGSSFLSAGMILGGSFPVLAVAGKCREEVAPVVECRGDSFFLTLTVDSSVYVSSPAFCTGTVISEDENCIGVKFSGVFDDPDVAMRFDSQRVSEITVSVTAFRVFPARVAAGVSSQKFSRYAKSGRIGAGRGICISNHQFNL